MIKMMFLMEISSFNSMIRKNSLVYLKNFLIKNRLSTFKQRSSFNITMFHKNQEIYLGMIQIFITHMEFITIKLT